MFTGIIEQLVEVVALKNKVSNLHISCKSAITQELKINQSVAHNGVCLTVIDIKDEVYTVTAIKETLDKTNLSELQVGDVINIERCMKLGDRFDGHMVQGHVDQTAICTQVKEENPAAEKIWVCPKHLATIDAPRPDKKWWPKRHKQKKALAAKGGIDLIFIGDSITYGWERRGQKA